MKKFNYTLLIVSALFMSASSAKAQDTEFKPHGQLWGYAFGDYAFKAHSDSVGSGAVPYSKGRGGSNQYTNMPQNTSMFQFRRIYLGYNYEISPKFSAEFLLAAEDDFNAGLDNQSAGDVLQNGKFSPYVKLANIRWKNIFKGSDLVFGQSNTPAFAKQGKNTQTSEEVWSYRSIERTVTDIRRTPSFDMGIKLEGTLPKNDNYGYVLMVGNGTSAKPETDMFKWFYGDIFAKFMDKKLVLDLYADYQRYVWTPTWHDDRQMTKLFVAYTVPKFTIGMEYYMNRIMADCIATRSGGKDTITSKANSLSLFVRGRITKDKWGFFARYDMYTPSANLNNGLYSAYSEQKVSQYDPNNNESFLTLGLDYTPIKNVHIMPNIWYNTYKNAGPASTAKPDDNDMVYRLTFYYIYGK